VTRLGLTELKTGFAMRLIIWTWFFSLVAVTSAGAVPVIAVFGDSLADGTWAGLYQELRHTPSASLYRDSKVGTGITRPDYDAFFNNFAATLGPDKITDVVVMFGANDEEGLRDETHKGYLFASPGWTKIYVSRVTKIITTCKAQGIKVYWLGLPVLRDSALNQGALYINSILQPAVQAAGGTFIPLQDDFKGKDGGFALTMADAKGVQRVLRAEDGVHFSLYGYDLIAKRVLAAMPAPK
jgi:hypothetical protein